MYVGRPSLLTELLQVSHMNSLYNMFVAIMILLLVNTFLHEALTTGTLVLLDWIFFSSYPHLTIDKKLNPLWWGGGSEYVGNMPPQREQPTFDLITGYETYYIWNYEKQKFETRLQLKVTWKIT